MHRVLIGVALFAIGCGDEASGELDGSADGIDSGLDGGEGGHDSGVDGGGDDGLDGGADGSVDGGAAVVCDNPVPDVELSPGDDLQAQIDASPEGAIFLLRAGVYRHAYLRPRQGQQFHGERGADCARLATLSGAMVLDGFAPSGGLFALGGQTAEGAIFEAEGVCREGFERCVVPEDLFVDGVPLHHMDELGEVGPGQWFFDYPADTVYLGDDPAGSLVELSVTPVAFESSAGGVLIRGLVIEKYATTQQGAAIGLGDGTIIEDCEVRSNHFAGIDSGPRSIARQNLVHDNGCFGFRGAGEDILVEGNEVSNNGVAGFSPWWGSGGSKWVYTTDLVVRGNFSHHNLGPGLWTDINNIGSLYEDNVVEDNERGGIFHEISYDAVIRGNTLRRNGTGRDYPYWTTGAGVEVVSSRNVEVYDNVLEDNWQGITGLDDHRGDGIDGPWTLVNLDVHDNTVTTGAFDEGAGRSGVVDFVGEAAYSAEANNHYDHNTYNLGANPNYFIWGPGGDCDETAWQGFGQDPTGTFVR